MMEENDQIAGLLERKVRKILDTTLAEYACKKINDVLLTVNGKPLMIQVANS